LQLIIHLIIIGSSYTTMQNVAKCLKLKFISHTTYYKIINEYVAPVIHDTWNNERDEYIGTLQENQNYDFRLCGDGQFDSPGHCAKYLCYTLMEVNTNKIVDFVLLQKKIVTGDLEKQACNMVLGRLIEDNVSVKMLVTDRHRGIGLLMRTNYKDIVHEYDVWHLAKSLAKKIKVGTCMVHIRTYTLLCISTLNNVV
jgi:hypothetical protein